MLYEELKRALKRFLPPSTSMVDARIAEVVESHARIEELIQGLFDELFALRQELEIARKPDRWSALAITPEELPGLVVGIDEPLVVSVASYGLRIDEMAPMLMSLRKQTRTPDLLCLMLPRDDFPHGVEDVPLSVLAAAYAAKAKICWVDDNLGSHNKYYCVMKELPNATVITLDDDVRYPSDLLEALVQCSERFPGCIVASRTHIIEFDAARGFARYADWEREQTSIREQPCSRLLPTGLGGVLYPPRSLSSRVFDRDTIKRVCPKADDLWLKAMSLIVGTKVVAPDYCFIPDYIGETQKVGLFNENLEGDGNDRQWEAIEKHLEEQGELARVLDNLLDTRESEN